MSDSAVDSRPTPGQLLCAARERTGLSFEAIADQLKMTVTKIAALEQDNYQPFPADTYLKGYLRNYARMVNLSEVEIIDSYEYFIAGHKQQSVSASLTEAAAESKANAKKKTLFLLLLVLLSILVAYYYLDRQSVSVDQVDDGANVSQSVDTEAANSKAQSADTANETQPASDASAESATANSVQQTTPLAAEQEMVATELAASANGDKLALVSQQAPAEPVALSAPSQSGYIFSFTENCWLEVVDSRGKKIISQQYNSGDSVKVEGQGPFKVLIGNASAARLTYNSKPVTITPRKNKNTLRITLNQ